MEQPRLGWTTPVKLVRVIDADTIVVSVSKEITLRLEGVDAPEIRRPASDAEIALGLAMKEELTDVLEEAEKIVMFIPTDYKNRIQDMFSIGARAVGRLFADGQDINKQVNTWCED